MSSENNHQIQLLLYRQGFGVYFQSIRSIITNIILISIFILFLGLIRRAYVSVVFIKSSKTSDLFTGIPPRVEFGGYNILVLHIFSLCTASKFLKRLSILRSSLLAPRAVW